MCMQFHTCQNKPFGNNSESSIHPQNTTTDSPEPTRFDIHLSDMSGFADQAATNSKATVRAKTGFECTVTYHTQQFRTWGEA